MKYFLTILSINFLFISHIYCQQTCGINDSNSANVWQGLDNTLSGATSGAIFNEIDVNSGDFMLANNLLTILDASNNDLPNPTGISTKRLFQSNRI